MTIDLLDLCWYAMLSSMPLWKRNLYVCLFGSFATTAGLSLVLPFLPLYLESLGLSDQAAVVRWSGYAFAATYLLAALVAPLWGRLADVYGRKPMLLRASLGMAVVMSLIGVAQAPWQVVFARLLMGAVAGYVTASIVMIATQAPSGRSGWALGMLSSAAVGGNLVGPLIGGWLAEMVGLRHAFFVTGGFLFVAFLVTALWVREDDFVPQVASRASFRVVWRSIANPRVVMALMLTSFMFQVANLSIEPIVTVYVKELARNTAHVAMISGVVVSAPAFAGMLSGPWLGKLADRFGADRILCLCLLVTGVSLVPQAWVNDPWQLTAMRFLMGLALAGLMPTISNLVKNAVPEASVGRIFGYMQSAQFLGQMAGPVLGGNLAAAFGLRAVFFMTAALMLMNAAFAAVCSKKAWRPLSEKRAGGGVGGGSGAASNAASGKPGGVHEADATAATAPVSVPGGRGGALRVSEPVSDTAGKQ
jgi:MFS family permease